MENKAFSLGSSLFYPKLPVKPYHHFYLNQDSLFPLLGWPGPPQRCPSIFRLEEYKAGCWHSGGQAEEKTKSLLTISYEPSK